MLAVPNLLLDLLYEVAHHLRCARVLLRQNEQSDGDNYDDDKGSGAAARALASAYAWTTTACAVWAVQAACADKVSWAGPAARAALQCHRALSYSSTEQAYLFHRPRQHGNLRGGKER